MKVKKRKGITLIELIITMAILSIIMGVVTVMFTTNSKIFSKVDIKSELQLEGETIQRELMKILPESKGVIAVDFSTTEVIGEITSFTVADEEYNHRFLLENGQLHYQKLNLDEDAVISDRILSSNVVSFGINPKQEEAILISENVKIKIKLLKQKGSQEIEYEIENYIVFRNFK